MHRIELDLSLCLAQARLSRISETATEGLASFDRIHSSKSPNCVAVRGSSQFLQSGKLFGQAVARPAGACDRALRAEGITGKRGKLVDKGYLYKLLNKSDVRG